MITMDRKELLLACRRGDLDKVRYLVEKKEVPLNNIRDNWDSTPLYYACLCGHKELVQYLLTNGAICEANTFDGERCIYGALTDEIRNILRTFKVVTPRTMRRYTYDEFLRKLSESSDFCDVVLETRDGTEFPSHKCVLACRSTFFRKFFSANPSCSRLTLKCHSGELFMKLKQFLYTGRMRMLVEDDKVLEIQRMAEDLLMTEFVDKLFDELDRFECENSRYLKRVQHIIIEPALGSTDLPTAFGVLADEYLRKDLMELPFGSQKARAMSYADVCFQVENVQFFGHKSFYCNRSEYFVALLRNHFNESSALVERNIPLVNIGSVSAEVFACIHDYIYRDYTDRLTGSNVFDVLYAAEEFLLSGLKKFCSSFVEDKLDLENTMALFRSARTFQLARLEDQCVTYIAHNLEHFLADKEFRDQVIEDANDVKERQETDSIAIIDDIRYHISANVQTYSDIEEANEKLYSIDDFLYKLNLDA